MINAKVVRVPGAVVDVVLEDGATVADALAAANITVGENEALSINSTPATTSTALTDGARIVLAKAAKGNNA